jgi:hypothetical protein
MAAHRPARTARVAGSHGTVDVWAEGGLLLFRVPRAAYESGPLELSIGDRSHPGSSGELILSS